MQELNSQEIAQAQHLFTKLQRQKGPDRENMRYYRGLQQVGNLGISVPPDVQPFAFPLNWCRTYADVLDERIDARMILRSGETDEDTELRQDWEVNELDTELHKFTKDMIILGRGCLSVASDPDGGRPRIHVEDPTNLAVMTNRLTRTTEAALRIVRDDTGRAEWMILYLPDETITMSREFGKWTAVDRKEHGLGRVPIIQQSPMATSASIVGETMLSDLKPLVNMAGRVMLNLQLAMETVATPQKVATGVSEADFKDENGNVVADPWERYLGAIWAISKKDAKVDQLPGATLDGFHDTIKMLAEQAATVTGLPVRMMGQNTANPAAEGAIRAEESRLVKKVERLNGVTGIALAWALEIAQRIRTREWGESGKIQVIWHDPATPTIAQRTDAVTKAAGNRPILSVRGALNELGFSQPRIDRELEWMEEENGAWSVDALQNRLDRIPPVPDDGEVI